MDKHVSTNIHGIPKPFRYEGRVIFLGSEEETKWVVDSAGDLWVEGWFAQFEKTDKSEFLRQLLEVVKQASDQMNSVMEKL